MAVGKDSIKRAAKANMAQKTVAQSEINKVNACEDITVSKETGAIEKIIESNEAGIVQKTVENKKMADKTTSTGKKPVNTVIGNISPEVLSSIRCDLPIHLL